MTLQQVIQALIDNKLNIINGSGQNIDNIGAQQIAEVLAANTAMRWLSLTNNQIGNEGAQNSLRLLMSNTVLISLGSFLPGLDTEILMNIQQRLTANIAVWQQAYTAVVNNDVASLSELLDRGISLNGIDSSPEETQFSGKKTLLHLAAERGHKNVTNLLLSRGALTTLAINTVQHLKSEAISIARHHS